MEYVNHTSKYCCRPNTVADLYNTVVRVLHIRVQRLHNSRIQHVTTAISCVPYDLNNKQRLFHLNLIARKYKMTISSTKTKPMATWGNHIQRVKIVINDNITEQVTDFKYMGYCISEFKSDVEDKLQT